MKTIEKGTANMQNSQPGSTGSSFKEKQKSALGKLINAEFIFSIIIPILLFLVFDKMGRTLTGTIAAGSWSLLMTVVIFIRDKKLSLYAILSLIFSVIGLVTTVVSNDPVYYLASPIVSDILLALVFFVSAAIGKPLIQQFAEYQMKDMFSPALRAKPMYKNAWMILTVAWGVLSLLQAFIRTVLLVSVSHSVYFSVSTFIGSVTTIIMLVGSVRFPSWYWKREKIKETVMKEARI